MATGDIKGNIAQLERSLRHLKYPAAVDDVGLMLGDPLAALPILNFALLKYSRHVAAYVVAMGGELQAKTDDGFVKAAFRLCREHLGIRTVLTPAQFLEQGYAERKVLLLCDVVKAARELHAAGAKQERAKVQAACRQSPARLHQLSASPNPKVEWGSLVSSSRLRKLPDTTATDASQSIFVPVGSVEKHHSPASKVASPAINSRVHQRLQFGSPAPSAAAAAGWPAHDISPSQDQLIAAGLMPVSSWRLPAAAAAAVSDPMTSPPAAAGYHMQDAVRQQQQQWDGADAGLASIQQQQHRSPQPDQDQEPELQQDSQWTRVEPLASSAQQSPAVALPQRQVWVPLQQQQQQQRQGPQEPQWRVDQQQWVPVEQSHSQQQQQQQQQQQSPAARTCLWPKKQQQQQQQQERPLVPQPRQQQTQQQVSAAAQEQPLQHEPARRLPPTPLQQNRSKAHAQPTQRQESYNQGGSQQPQQPPGQCVIAAADQQEASPAPSARNGSAQHLHAGAAHQSMGQKQRQQQQPVLVQQQQGHQHAQQQGAPGQRHAIQSGTAEESRQSQQPQQQQQQQRRQQHVLQQQQLALRQQEASQQQLEQQQQQLLQQQEQQQQDVEELLAVQGEQQVALTDAQQAIVHMQEALARAEAQLQEHRTVTRHFEESVGARITVLEGRLKLMEAQVANSARCCPVCHAREREQAEVLAAATAGRLAGDSTGSARKQGGQHAWLYQSPLKSPARASPGGINWRAAASAAASAVMTGLSSSPQPGWQSNSPHKPASAGDSAATTAGGGGASGGTGVGPRQLYMSSSAQQGKPPTPAEAVEPGSRPTKGAGGAVGVAATGANVDRSHVQKQPEAQSEGLPTLAPQGAKTASVASQVSGTDSLPSGGPNTPQAAVGNAAGSAVSGSSSTRLLINQLASRAAEAQRLLQSLHS